ELPSRHGDRPGPEPAIFSVETPQSWCLRVGVCQRSHPWIKAAKNPDLRKVRSILDGFALPRVILPATDAAHFRDDYVALIALFAAKADCLARQDDKLPRFFRGYCDTWFRRGAVRQTLAEAEWYGAVDRVFERLYGGKVGMGFTMPAYPESFRAYVSQALRGAVAQAQFRSPQPPKPGQVPASIEQAAARLGVSHMTVRRCMRRLQLSEWTEQAWPAVSADIREKKGWQEVTARLQASGLGPETARKRVRRWKSSGLPLDEAFQKSAPAKLPRGTCAACGEE